MTAADDPELTDDEKLWLMSPPELIDEVQRLRAECARLEHLAYPEQFVTMGEGLSDAALARLCDDVIAAGDVDDAHYELVMPFVVVESKGGPFEDEAYCAGWEAGTIDVKLMALTSLGQSATDLLCRDANWPQVSLLLLKHGWSVDESSMSIADGWVSVKVVGF